MASSLEKSWVYATVMIETSEGRGTGFFVSRRRTNEIHDLFLVTNKHVLHHDRIARAAMSSITIHFNTLRDGVLSATKDEYPLAIGNACLVREHPDEGVDVLAIRTNAFFNFWRDSLGNHVAGEEDSFAMPEIRKQLDITVGEEIVLIGYPNGIRQGRTNLPLLRQGLIASRPEEDLHEDDGATVRITRGFLIDAGAVPGSSGSPVVLKPVGMRHQHDVVVTDPVKPVLLGILAETRFANIPHRRGYIPGFAGLGLVFNVETIVETLDLF